MVGLKKQNMKNSTVDYRILTYQEIRGNGRGMETVKVVAKILLGERIVKAGGGIKSVWRVCKSGGAIVKAVGNPRLSNKTSHAKSSNGIKTSSHFTFISRDDYKRVNPLFFIIKFNFRRYHSCLGINIK